MLPAIQNQGGVPEQNEMLAPPSLQQIRKVNNRKGALLGKNAVIAPDGFYCYYPELFEKPNCMIFVITKHPENKPQPQNFVKEAA